MTNQEVAERLGCHHSMVSRMRAGKRVCGYEMAERLADEFKIRRQIVIDARRAGAVAFGKLLRERIFKEDDAAVRARELKKAA